MSSNLHINGPITRFYNYIRLNRAATILKPAQINEVGLMALYEARSTFDDTVAVSLADGKGTFDWRYLVHTITADNNMRAVRDVSSGIVELFGPDIRPGEGVSINKGTDTSTGNPYLTINLAGGGGTSFSAGYGLRFVRDLANGNFLENTHRLYAATITPSVLDASGRCWIPDVYIDDPGAFWLTSVYTQDGQQTYPDVYLSSISVSVTNSNTGIVTNTTKYIICIDFGSTADFTSMSGGSNYLYCKIYIDNAAPVPVRPTNTKPNNGSIIDDEEYT